MDEAAECQASACPHRTSGGKRNFRQRPQRWYISHDPPKKPSLNRQSEKSKITSFSTRNRSRVYHIRHTAVLLLKYDMKNSVTRTIKNIYQVSTVRYGRKYITQPLPRLKPNPPRSTPTGRWRIPPSFSEPSHAARLTSPTRTRHHTFLPTLIRLPEEML